ncbi:MAG: hypothetical protein CMQ14_10700 [Gammaproteobacteria bacterium]|nr:hypothetical protein [Gammaproteobacteria bacterium]
MSLFKVLLLGLLIPASLTKFALAQNTDVGITCLALTPDLQAEPRKLNVIGSTLAPEEIDRAVLNCLMQEIAHQPDRTASVLGFSRETLQDVFISISNARNFINDNEMANLRAMCGAWERSSLEGDARIEEALEVDKKRRQLTLSFIQKFYRLVVADIKSILIEPEQLSFRRHMDDRRRRMASAGNVYSRAIFQNVRYGAELINLHYRDNRPPTGAQ